MKQLNKVQKISLYGLLFATLLFVLWLLCGMPRFSAQSAYHRIEQRQMLEPGTLLGRWESNQIYHPSPGPNSGAWRTHLMAGVTDSHLRMTLLEQRGIRWNSPNKLVSFPLEAYTFGVLPWDGPQSLGEANWAGACGFLYTKEPYARGEATLTVGETIFRGKFVPDAGELSFFSFPGLYDTRETMSQMELLAIRLQGTPVFSDISAPNISLELVLFDAHGGEITRMVKHYPAG